uniref:RING-type domain-containing protein n=1 Tax=Paramoeba aestuarina TaxID=180227 RepID=A0A7S4PH60_9EUKA|mmetsp:Transcript_6266/g.9493  ORF Transcript_6266/g.9493 Transcript_6266/m.9493 type:complete len:254 (+) Transcript_6266:68-829(+)
MAAPEECGICSDQKEIEVTCRQCSASLCGACWQKLSTPLELVAICPMCRTLLPFKVEPVLQTPDPVLELVDSIIQLRQQTEQEEANGGFKMDKFTLETNWPFPLQPLQASYENEPNPQFLPRTPWGRRQEKKFRSFARLDESPRVQFDFYLRRFAVHVATKAEQLHPRGPIRGFEIAPHIEEDFWYEMARDLTTIACCDPLVLAQQILASRPADNSTKQYEKMAGVGLFNFFVDQPVSNSFPRILYELCCWNK